MILLSIFLCFCLASAVNYFSTRQQRKAIKNLKGPFSWPLLGAMHLPALLSPTNFFKRSSAYLQKYGNLTRCWVFHRLFIPLADLELAAQLLQSEQHLDTGYELMQDWLGESVLMCSMQQWPQRHQLLMQLFEPASMWQLLQRCKLHAAQLQQQLQLLCGQRAVFDAWQLVAPALLHTVLDISCGLSTLQHSEFSAQYAQTLTELVTLYRQRFLSLKSANRFSYWLSSPFRRRRQQRLIQRLNAYNQQLLLQLETPKTPPCGIDMQQLQLPNLPCSLLQRLQASGQLSATQICAELNNFNYMGYLHGSTALCFALVMIARHPRVQQQCYEELRAAQADNAWQAQPLPYMQAVLKETLRLFPPQPIVGRQLSTDFAYIHSLVGNAVLPKGAEIYVNLYEMQRNEFSYPAGSQFQPQRYLKQAQQQAQSQQPVQTQQATQTLQPEYIQEPLQLQQPSQPLQLEQPEQSQKPQQPVNLEQPQQPPQLLSFGLGPRCCPAQQFSLLLLQSLLAAILLQFELLPYGDELRLELKLVLGSSNGFQLALRTRNDAV